MEFWGTGGHEEPTSDQYRRYEYPISQGKGGTEIHMMWTDTPCRVTCWGGGGEVMEAFRNPKIECVVAQHPWLENDCLCADIILPTTTTLECDDISPCIREGDSFQNVILMNGGHRARRRGQERLRRRLRRRREAGHAGRWSPTASATRS